MNFSKLSGDRGSIYMFPKSFFLGSLVLRMVPGYSSAGDEAVPLSVFRLFGTCYPYGGLTQGYDGSLI